jgi:hypothetical protein
MTSFGEFHDLHVGGGRQIGTEGAPGFNEEGPVWAGREMLNSTKWACLTPVGSH